MSADPNAHPEQVWEAVRQVAKRLFGLSRDQGDLTRLDIDAWRQVYPAANPGDFIRALQRHAASGAEWMPRPGTLGRYLSADQESLPWSMLWTAITVGCRRCNSPEAAAAKVFEITGSVAGSAWTAATWNRIQSAPVGDPQSGHITIATFAKDWAGYAEASAERAALGLPPVTAEQMLPAAHRGPRRLDPSAFLQIEDGPGE